MKRILMLNPFGIGDVLFTTPVLRAIKNTWPDSLIGYWCNKRVSPILKSNPNIDKVFSLSRGDLKRIYQVSKIEGIRRFIGLFSDLKKEKFEICLDFSLDHRYSLFSKLLGIKRRIGFNYRKRTSFLTDKVDIDGYNSKHVVEYYLSLLELIGVKAEGNTLELYIPEADKVRGRLRLLRAGITNNDLIIGIAPGAGASWGRDAALKHWPAIKFAQLADRIIQDFGHKVVILGDQSERPIVDVIINTMKNKAADLVGKTNLEELAAIIDNLSILVANDGGPLHIAVAREKKTVSFFGPVDPKVYGPYPDDEKRHIVLAKPMACSPCYRNFRLSICENNKGCLEDISVGEAMHAVAQLLAK